VSEKRPETFAVRPRPLADAPVERLEDHAEELARRWAIALVEARPLAEMTAVPLEEIARIGPGLCAALVRALSSEAALDALAPGGDSRAASVAEDLRGLAARWDAATMAECVEALRRVLWAAALSELDEAAPRGVAAGLSDRLAGVCAALLAHALSGSAPDAAGTVAGGGAAGPGPPAPGGQVLYTSPPLPGRSGATLIDEHGDRPGTPAPQTSRAAPATTPRPLPWDTPLRAPGPSGAEVRAARASDEDAAVRASRGPGAPIDRRS
jgi:hypothetical protein